MTAVDVIIPTARLGEHVDALLSDLAQQLAAHRELVDRIAVVDDRAVTDVRSSLLEGGEARVHAWPSSSNGPAVNRNRGAQDSVADWLIFLDDDVRLDRGWADALAALLNRPDSPEVIGGRIGSQQPANWFSQAAEDFVVRHREYPEGWHLAAAHLLIRRSTFECLGGFDTRFAYGAEDWDLSRRAHAAGITVGVVQQPSVAHANPTSWRQLRLKAEQYGRANATFDSPGLTVVADPESTIRPAASLEPPRDALPSPVRGLRWARSEYHALRRSGRGRLRSSRTMVMYIPWMAVYLRAQSSSRSPET